ncbi:N-myc-interactor [Salarias fasciatus]|uniref:N-myc-interactor-like n=1 Tax=Salarias fasciatus TaxID=181472 RepID=A0A672HKI9_SALFA|nr:N-myc-interactor-like [Salarias fasciatus]
MSDLNMDQLSAEVGELRDTNNQLRLAKAELESWKRKVEKADDVKAMLVLEKLEEDDKKKNIQQEMMACSQRREERQKDLTDKMNKVKGDVQQQDERKQKLLAQLKKLQDELQARKVQSSKLKQKFKICTQIPDTEVNFQKQHREESEVYDDVAAGVFTIIKRVDVPLKGGQALITFEEEKVASQVLKLNKCSMSYENSTVEVTPVKVIMDPSVKFEVHLDVSRRAVKVSNVPPSMAEERVRDRLHISFSKPSRGGAEVETVEYDMNTGTGRIAFLQPGAAERLALKGKHQVDLDPDEVSVQVGPEFSYKLRRFQTFCGTAKRTVLLDNIQVAQNVEDEEDVQDHLEIYFQKPSNRGGEIESIKYLSKGKALRAFFCEDSVQTDAAL